MPNENPTPYPFVKEYETMFCDKCPHQAEINAALAPCQTCECAADGQHGNQHAHDAWCMQCPQMKVIQRAMRPCDACEAGKLRGEVHIDGSDAAKTALQHALPVDHSPSAGVTALPPDVEDALRRMLFVIFDFKPIELLMIQHVVHGHGVSTFRKPLAELKERLNRKYDLAGDSRGFGATAHEWKKRIVAKFPAIAEMFDAEKYKDNGKGHGCRR